MSLEVILKVILYFFCSKFGGELRIFITYSKTLFIINFLTFKSSKNMDSKIQEHPRKFWRMVSDTIELVFQEGALQYNYSEQAELKGLDHKNSKKFIKTDDPNVEGVIDESQGPSRQIIDISKTEAQNIKFEAFLEETFLMDQTTNLWLANNRDIVPKITVNFILPDSNNNDETDQNQNIYYVEAFLCEKSSCQDREKFKILKGGLKGQAKWKCAHSGKIELKNLRFNYSSNPDKNSRLILVLYQKDTNNIRKYKSILISEEVFLIQQGKSLVIDSKMGIRPYFQLFEVQFMERPPPSVKINKNDKHHYLDEISTFEKYLIKKNKKVLNIIYLAFKYPHFVELYFRGPTYQQGAVPQNIHPLSVLGNLLAGIQRQIDETSLKPNQGISCNHLNPDCKILLKINCNLRKIRFFVQKKFTSILSIVASEQIFQNENYLKTPNLKQLKDFYMDYHMHAVRCKLNSEHNLKAHSTPASVNSQNQIPIQTLEQQQALAEQQKKKLKRKSDDEFSEQDVEEVQEIQSSQQNYSISDRKHGKRGAPKKLESQKKSSQMIKENKYPTRKSKRDQDDEEGSDRLKKNNLGKKIKEKDNKKFLLPPAGLVDNNSKQSLNSQNSGMPFRVVPNPLQNGNGQQMNMMQMGQMQPLKDGKKDTKTNGPQIPSMPMMVMVPGNNQGQMQGMFGFMPGGSPQAFQGMGGNFPYIIMQGGMNGLQGMNIPNLQNMQNMPGFANMMQGMQGMQGMSGMPNMYMPNPGNQQQQADKKQKQEKGESSQQGYQNFYSGMQKNGGYMMPNGMNPMMMMSGFKPGGVNTTGQQQPNSGYPMIPFMPNMGNMQNMQNMSFGNLPEQANNSQQQKPSTQNTPTSSNNQQKMFKSTSNQQQKKQTKQTKPQNFPPLQSLPQMPVDQMKTMFSGQNPMQFNMQDPNIQRHMAMMGISMPQQLSTQQQQTQSQSQTQQPQQQSQQQSQKKQQKEEKPSFPGNIPYMMIPNNMQNIGGMPNMASMMGMQGMQAMLGLQGMQGMQGGMQGMQGMQGIPDFISQRQGLSSSQQPQIRQSGGMQQGGQGGQGMMPNMQGFPMGMMPPNMSMQYFQQQMKNNMQMMQKKPDEDKKK